MRVLKHQYIDVHYNEEEEKKAKKYGKQLISGGYVLEHADVGSDHDYCDQYWKIPRTLINTNLNTYNMKDETNSININTWKDIIASTKISEKHYEKVAEFCDRFAREEGSSVFTSMPKIDATKSMLPLNLKILEKLDLDKVELSDDLEGMETVEYELDLNVDELMHGGLVGEHIKDIIENATVTMIAATINEKVKHGHEIVMHTPCQSITVISEKSGKPNVYVKTRYKLNI